MKKEHAINEVLLATREDWDNPATAAHVRATFWKVLNCGTILLGAEVFASETEQKLVYHTCKSKFCTSCGHRATQAWQQELEATLPEIPYLSITLTMPKEFWPILQENRHLLHGMPAIGAEAIRLWLKSRYGVHVFLIVVQHTFGGFLNFYPHLHVLVSAGGLVNSEAEWKWLPQLKNYEGELMYAWRFTVLAYLAEALKCQVLQCEASTGEIKAMLETQFKRTWNIDISRRMSKAHFLKYVARYIRRPPIAQHRLTRITAQEVEYLAKDTKNDCFVNVRYSNEQFVAILQEQVPDRGRHAMRYFGLLAPRTKALTWAALFVLLKQKRRPVPRRLTWRYLLRRSFGIDPLKDSSGQIMHWIGRVTPVSGG